ncbi:hypothetical protein ACFX10_032942 [Malus domestica]
MVATGRYFRTKGMARNVSVHLQEYDFRADFHLLAVVGCDMVLGVDWLETLGLIGWNFLLKVIEFTVQGTNYRLVGSSAHSTGAIPPLSSLDPSLLNPLHIVAQIFNLPTELYHPAPLPDILQALLLKYSDLFEASTTLPPHRFIDHRISLLPRTGPMNVRPYHYGHVQKAELERQVEEMLATGIIQPSHNPFSSPILLMAKEDNT